jgi:SNF2 family DNA or RNA helicase
VLPQLPDIVHQYRYPEMSPRQHKAYNEMRDDMIARLNELLVAKNPLAQAGRLSLFAAASADVTFKPCPRCEGGYPNPVCEICHGTGKQGVINLVEPSSKIDDLIEFINDEGRTRPLVVAAESKRLIKLTEARLVKEKLPFVSLTGDTPSQERAALIKTFQDGGVPLFLMTSATGGEGITLTRADTIFRMIKSFAVRTNTQVRDRVHRIGSETHDSVRVIDQVAPGTVDERKEDILDGKMGRIEDLVRDKDKLRWLLNG